jgi:hypothetical protein
VGAGCVEGGASGLSAGFAKAEGVRLRWHRMGCRDPPVRPGQRGLRLPQQAQKKKMTHDSGKRVRRHAVSGVLLVV